MKYLISSIFLSLCFTITEAQQLFQDGSGESTLYMGDWNYTFARFNSSSDKVSVGINRIRRSGNDKEKTSFFGGAELGVKAKDGKADLFSKDAFNSGIQLNFLIGIKSFELDTSNSWFTIFARPGISYNKYNIVSEIDPLNPVVSEKEFTSPEALVHFNFQINRPFTEDAKDKSYKKGDDRLYHFIGFSVGYRRHNNINDLTTVSINSVTSATSTQVVSTVKTGYAGSYKDFHQLPVNFDYAILPRILKSHLIGFNYFLRSGFAAEAYVTNTGVGIFFTKPNEPSNVLGGLAFQSTDIFNGYRKDTDALQRSSVFFYVGFNIAGK